MLNFSLRSHPDVLFGYSTSHVELIIRVENNGTVPMWAEADVSVPEHISLAPNGPLHKGRIRLGIIGKKESLEKSVRVYSTMQTAPLIYRCNAVLYLFNKDGVIDTRLEKPIDIRCEKKRDASL